MNLTASAFPAACFAGSRSFIVALLKTCRGESERISVVSSLQIEDSPPLAFNQKAYNSLVPHSGAAGIFKSLRLFVRVLAVAAVLSAGGLSARDAAADPDSVFSAAVSAYKAGRNAEALSALEALDRKQPGHALTTASLLLQAKALFRMGESQRSREAFEELILTYPQSAYVDDARYGLADLLYRRNAVRESLLQLLSLISGGGNRALVEKAEIRSLEIMESHFTTDELRGLVRDVPEEKGKAFVTLAAARRNIQDRRFETARADLDHFLRSAPDNPYASQMEKLRGRSESLGKGSAVIGVILPLSGPLGDQGGQLLAGIQHRDSEGITVQAIRAAQEICRNEDVAAVIGDLDSQVSEAVAAVAQENEVPCIAPLAMSDGMTGIGGYIFQLNGTLGDRGRVLAEYACASLGLKRFAVLTPGDGYGRVVRKAFVEEVTRSGGEILADRTFSEETRDFSPVLAAIREAGLKRFLQDSVRAARGDVSGEIMTGAIDRKVGRMLENRDIPVRSVDGLFILPHRTSLESILAQIHYQNFETQLLAGSSLDDLSVLLGRKEMLDGIVFFSEYFADPYSPRVAAFRTGFRKDTGRNPGSMEAIGYDAASVVLQAMGDKTMPRSEIRDALASIRNLEGIRGKITFDGNRVNSAFRLLQFKEGRVDVVR
jgi:ABC-type branched-subunit amino acid transport system substrate-binding protein